MDKTYMNFLYSLVLLRLTSPYISCKKGVFILFFINYNLILISFVLFILSYFIGVKKQIWLLPGFNERRIRNKEKASKLVGLSSLVGGLLTLTAGFILAIRPEIVIFILIAGYIFLVIYTHKKLGSTAKTNLL